MYLQEDMPKEMRKSLFRHQMIHPVPVCWRRSFFKESDTFQKNCRDRIVLLIIFGKIRTCLVPIPIEICHESFFVVYNQRLVLSLFLRGHKIEKLINIRCDILPLHGDPIDFTKDKIFHYLLCRIFGEDDIRVVQFIHSFKSGCEIYSIADNRVIGKCLVADIPDDDFPRCDTKPHIDGNFCNYTERWYSFSSRLRDYFTGFYEFIAFSECFQYLKGCGAGKNSMFAVSYRRSPKGKNRIPDIFIDRPLIFEDNPVCDMEKAIQCPYELLGIEFLAQTRKSLDIREKYRDFPFFEKLFRTDFTAQEFLYDGFIDMTGKYSLDANLVTVNEKGTIKRNREKRKKYGKQYGKIAKIPTILE